MPVRIDPPQAIKFAQLRNQMGWGDVLLTDAAKALSNSLFFACFYKDEQLIAFGRAIGDNALNYYIQDVIVARPYRKQGYGHMVLKSLLEQIHAQAPKGAIIGLLAAKNMDGFYEKFGFRSRPNSNSGSGMTLIV